MSNILVLLLTYKRNILDLSKIPLLLLIQQKQNKKKILELVIKPCWLALYTSNPPYFISFLKNSIGIGIGIGIMCLIPIYKFIFTSIEYDSFYFVRKLIGIYRSIGTDRTDICTRRLLIGRNLHWPKRKITDCKK